jgi:hypothetical protein
MKVVLWIFLIALVVCFGVVIIQQMLRPSAPSQNAEVCRVDAEALLWYEWTFSWAPFALIYFLLCRARWRGMGPLERLLLAFLVTVGLFGFTFWAWMTSRFHVQQECSTLTLPFGTFLSAWTSPLLGIAVLIAVTLTYNWVRRRRVAPKEA